MEQFSKQMSDLDPCFMLCRDLGGRRGRFPDIYQNNVWRGWCYWDLSMRIISVLFVHIQPNKRNPVFC